MKSRLTAVAVAMGLVVATWGLALSSVPSAVAKGAAGNTFVAQLSGDHEVPPVSTSGHGNAHFKVSKDGSTVSYKVVVNKLTEPVAAAHVHFAPAGSNGPVVVALYPGDEVKTNKNTTIFSGSFPMSAHPSFQADADAGLLYVNVHTTAHPSGEVRGQLD